MHWVLRYWTVAAALPYKRLGKMPVDANGVPCKSFLANKQSCEHLQKTPHIRHYAFCEVQSDSKYSCPEPSASAMDAEGNELGVKKTIVLFVKSDPQQRPAFANKTVKELDYKQRGEYTIQYDATDSNGIPAQTVLFNLFMNDHRGPHFTINETNQLKHVNPYDTSSRLWCLPGVKAHDAYDGDVSRTLQATLTYPNTTKAHASSEADTQALHIDTLVKGEYKVVYSAHDFAAVFGQDHTENEAVIVGHISMVPFSHLTFSSGTRHFTLQYPRHAPPFLPPAPPPAPPAPVPVPVPSTTKPPHHSAPPSLPPTASPTGPPTLKPTSYVSIPPVIILQLLGQTVTRGSPYGEHKTRAKYLQHLHERGYEDERIAAHLEAIVLREEEMGVLLGEDHKWWFRHAEEKPSLPAAAHKHSPAVQRAILRAAGRWPAPVTRPPDLATETDGPAPPAPDLGALGADEPEEAFEIVYVAPKSAHDFVSKHASDKDARLASLRAGAAGVAGTGHAPAFGGRGDTGSRTGVGAGAVGTAVGASEGEAAASAVLAQLVSTERESGVPAAERGTALWERERGWEGGSDRGRARAGGESRAPDVVDTSSAAPRVPLPMISPQQHGSSGRRLAQLSEPRRQGSQRLLVAGLLSGVGFVTCFALFVVAVATNGALQVPVAAAAASSGDYGSV